MKLVPGENLKGEVRDARGRPIPGADIAIHSDVGIRHTRTDKKGQFGTSDLAPGRIALLATAEGFAPASKTIDISASNGRRPTEAPPLELEEEAVVEGVVTDAKGEPIAGARVAKDAVPVFLAVGSVGGAGRGTSSDAKGRFRLGSLPEGEITLEAYVPEIGRAQLRNVSVRRGKTTDVGKIVVVGEKESRQGPGARGGVAITLGETGGDVHEVVVVQVAEGSEAERAGLVPGDLLVEVSGKAVHAIDEARARLSGAVGDDVLVRIKRGESNVVLRVGREEVRR